MTTPLQATLLDILIDGFEKNEIMRGFHWRSLPMSDESAAVAKLEALAEEGRRWKGQPLRSEEHDGRRVIAWPDLQLRQAGRGVMVLVRAPRFGDWWHSAATWRDDPMCPLYEWLHED